MSGNYDKLEPRVKTVEEAVRVLTELAIRADERMDGFDYGFANVSVKLEALTDAQLRTEEAHRRTEEAQLRTEEAQLRTEEAQLRTEEAQGRTDEAQRRTEEAFARLAESQARTGESLDALIRIVREDRESRNGH